jgi:hypothetical protein
MLPSKLIKRLYSSSASALPTFSALNVSEERKGVYHVELNRPKTRNSLTMDVWR